MPLNKGLRFLSPNPHPESKRRRSKVDVQRLTWIAERKGECMNRGGVYRSSLVQQMIEGNPNLWSMNSQEIPSLLSSPSASSSSSFSSAASAVFPKYSKFASFNPMLIPCHENQEQLPVVSWSQLLLGEFGEEEDGCRNVANYPKRMENNWKDQIMCSSANTQVLDVKKEDAETGHGYYSGKDKEGSSWSQQLAVAASSPRSCVTSSNILDFSNCKTQRKHHQLDNSNSECNSNGGAALKKARIQSSSVQSTLKVRKEKLGDRIAALHQLVSPFGKTDTASVLSEAIGYIRFLQTQIQALSSPYLRNGSRNSRNSELTNSCVKSDQDGDDEPNDLRSRGLCLMPVSFLLHVGSDDSSVDFWAHNFGMILR